MTQIVYVYAIGHQLDVAALGDVNGVSGIPDFHLASDGTLSAVYSLVPAESFSQQAIDSRGGDLEWLSQIGYSHQRVNERLADRQTTIPLRAFTLFTSPDALLQYLKAESGRLTRTLERLDGRREWTLRVELEPEEWNKAVIRRVEELRRLATEAESAPAGKAYLLRKKLEESKAKAAKQAEESLLQELEEKLRSEISGEFLVESRQKRAGSFPQINLLLSSGEAEKLQALEPKLSSEYRDDGVTLALTGPWPAYSFTQEKA